MAIEWYVVYLENDGELSFGIDWQKSETTSSVTITPIIYRYDKYSTDNYGGSWAETIWYEPSGESKTWSNIKFGSGSGTRAIDTWGSRTYTKKSGSYSVTIAISWFQAGTYLNGRGFKNFSDGTCSWSIMIPSSSNEITVTFNGNGGTPSENSQTKVVNRLYEVMPECYKAKNRFTGWYTSASGGTKINYNTTITNTSNHTLYAHWETLSTPTISSASNKDGKTILIGANNSLGALPSSYKWEYSSNGTSGWTTLSGQTNLCAIHETSTLYYYRLTATYPKENNTNPTVTSNSKKATSLTTMKDVYLPSNAKDLYFNGSAKDISFKEA